MRYLRSLLKEEGWAEALVGGMGFAYRGGAAFNVDISLTEAGLAQRDQVIGELTIAKEGQTVTQAVFSAR